MRRPGRRRADCDAQRADVHRGALGVHHVQPGRRSSASGRRSLDVRRGGADRGQPGQTCDTTQGLRVPRRRVRGALRPGVAEQSNVGCEYWGADLDNADISPSSNAAAQQYAIVVSNVQPDVAAHVTVEQDDSSPGDARTRRRVVATAIIAPQNLEVFNLGPREVDGSADGTFNTGTGTALTRHAYQVTERLPDRRLPVQPARQRQRLLERRLAAPARVRAQHRRGPRLRRARPGRRPSRITSDPTTNFGIDLRAFLAIVATRANTHVQVQTTARVDPRRPVRRPGSPRARRGTATLQPFEVLNLETGDFNADFTGSLVSADQPVAVFPGSEASDAPTYTTLARPLLLRRPPRAPDAAAPHRRQVVRARQDAQPHVGGHRRRRRHRRDPRDGVLPRRGRDAGDHARHDDAAGAVRTPSTSTAQGDFADHPLAERLPALQREPAGDGAAGAGEPGRGRRPARAARRRSEHAVPFAPSSSGAATTCSSRRTSTSSTIWSSSRPSRRARVRRRAGARRDGLRRDAVRRPDARDARIADAAVLDLPLPALVPHHRPHAAAAEQHPARQAERRRAPHPVRSGRWASPPTASTRT